MREQPADQRSRAWIGEIRVTFDRDELEGFFDGFAPLDSPSDLLDSLLNSDSAKTLPIAA